MYRLKMLFIVSFLFIIKANAGWVLSDSGPEMGHSIFISSYASPGAVHCFAVSAKKFFAGTDSGGVFLSNDSGRSWISVNSGLQNKLNSFYSYYPILSLFVKDSLLFAGLPGGNIWVSSISVISWKFAAALPSSMGNVYALASIDTFLFAGCYGNGAFLSTNQGQNWSAINTGLTYSNDKAIMSFAVIDSNLFAATYGGGVFRTTNKGASWVQIYNGLLNSEISVLAAIDSNLFAASDVGVFRTTNKGISWTNTGFDLSLIDAFTVTGNSIFAGIQGMGIFVSNNNGVSWYSVNDLLAYNYITSLIVFGNSLFAGNEEGMVWRRQLSEIISGVPPTIPITIFPSVGALNIPVTTLLVWHAISSGAFYHLQVSHNPNFYNVVKDTMGLKDTSFALSGLTKNTVYYWRLNAELYGPAQNSATYEFSYSAWSTTDSFTTNNTITAISPRNFDFSSFNYGESGKILRYTLPYQCMVSLKYFDVQGKMLASFINQLQNSGKYSLPVPIASWAQGTYIQVFKAGNFLNIDRIAIIR